MKVIVAIDSFKGCLSSAEANAAAREGILLSVPDAEIIEVPVSDGGEGWLDAFRTTVSGELIEIEVCDPLLRPIMARYLKHNDEAVIEMAQANGLALLTAEERNPLEATTYGTGQMIADAVRRGCRKIIVGLGGSATSDAGKGMMRALKDAFGEDLSDLKDVHFTIATDVRNPLYGPDGAAAVFAPQKGATPDMVAELDRRAKVFAAQAAQQMGFDRSMMPGAGAAGGLGYAFMQFLNAQCRPGIDLLLDAIGFQSLLQNADLVITGEGSADRQTLMGKLPTGILRRAQLFHIPVVLIAGRVANREDLLRAGFARVGCINPPNLPLQEALLPHVAKANIRRLMKTCIP